MMVMITVRIIANSNVTNKKVKSRTEATTFSKEKKTDN